jgi:hypothetical protein
MDASSRILKYLTEFRATGWMSEVQIPKGGKTFLRNVQAGSGDHPTSYPIGTGGKLPGREAYLSPPPSAEVKNGEAIPPLPHMSSWHSA